ncbi:MAG: fumarylacetoacetate hydrolase family protein, partial [Actinomycetales bacterium]
MRICRVAVDGEPFFGVLEGVDEWGEVQPDAMVALLRGHPFGEFAPDGRVLPVADLRLLAPVIPSKIVAVGRNYADHAAELGNQVPVEPMLFLKPSTSVIGPGDAIALPWQSDQVDHEGELAVVIARLCRDVAEDDAESVILGYTCANDVT